MNELEQHAENLAKILSTGSTTTTYRYTKGFQAGRRAYTIWADSFFFGAFRQYVVMTLDDDDFTVRSPEEEGYKAVKSVLFKYCRENKLPCDWYKAS